MGIGIGISLVSVLVSHGYRGGSLKNFRFALRAIVSVLVSHGYRYRYLICIGTGISCLSVSASHGFRHGYLIGIGIGTSSVSVSALNVNRQLKLSPKFIEGYPGHVKVLEKAAQMRMGTGFRVLSCSIHAPGQIESLECLLRVLDLVSPSKSVDFLFNSFQSY